MTPEEERQAQELADKIVRVTGAIFIRALWFLIWFALPFVAHNR